MTKTFEHWLKIAENNQNRENIFINGPFVVAIVDEYPGSGRLELVDTIDGFHTYEDAVKYSEDNKIGIPMSIQDWRLEYWGIENESKKVHKYELHFSDGIRGMRGGENVDSLIRYAKSIKGIKEWSIFKTGTGFHGTHQDEFLVSWWDKDDNSYWSNRSVKEPKLLDKKYEEFKVNESNSSDLIDNMTRFEDISEIKDIIRSKVESTFKLKDVTFKPFGQTYYEYGFEGKGFRSRTRDEYIINLPNQDPIKYLNDKEKELLYALSPNFFNNSKNRTPIFLKATIGEAISIKDGQNDKKYHIIGIALYIYNADSNVLNAGGVFFNELLSGTSAAYAKTKMQGFDFITEGLLNDFYFKYNNSKEISSNTVSQGIGSAASDLVTTHYKDAWDVSALMDVFDNDKNKVIEFLKTNFHFNRLKNIQIDNNILHATSSSTIKYDSVNKDNTLNKVNESFNINRFRELSKLSQIQELTYILNKEFSNYTFVNDGLTILCNTNIPIEDLKEINDYIENLIGHNKYNIVTEKLTDKASNYISKKIVKLREEGYPQKQAIAIAYSYAKKKGYKVDESKSSLQDKIQKFKDLKDSKDIIVASGSTESLYYFPTDDNDGTIFLVIYNPMSKNWDIMTFDYWNGTKKEILDLTSKEGAKKAYSNLVGEEEPNEDEYEVMNLLTGSEAIESYNRLLNKIESKEFSKRLLSESSVAPSSADFTQNDYMYYAKAIGKKLKANNLYDYEFIYADSNDATGNGEGQLEIGNYTYEYNIFDYTNVDTKDGSDKVNFKVRVYKDDFEIGYNEFKEIDPTNAESLITNYIVDLILTEGKNLNESHNGSGLIVKGRTDMDTEKIKDFLVSSDFYGEYDNAEDYFFFPEEQSLLISLENLLQDEFDKLDIEVNITTTGLNESHFKFNSMYNTIDLSSVKEFLDSKDFKYFTPADVDGIFDLKFAAVLQVNPAMEVYCKSINNAKAEGKNQYSYDNGYGQDYEYLENALLIIETKKEFDSISISNFLDKNPILVPNTTNESHRLDNEKIEWNYYDIKPKKEQMRSVIESVRDLKKCIKETFGERVLNMNSSSIYNDYGAFNFEIKDINIEKDAKILRDCVDSIIVKYGYNGSSVIVYDINGEWNASITVAYNHINTQGNDILMTNFTESKKSDSLEDKIYLLQNELTELKDDRKQLMIDMENDPAVINNTDGEEAQEYGSKLNDIDDEIEKVINKITKAKSQLYDLENPKKFEPTTFSILKKNIDDIKNSMKVFSNRTEEENAKIFKKRYAINDTDENIIIALNKLLSKLDESLSKGHNKISVKDSIKLVKLANDNNISDFITEFAIIYGSACDMWMDEKDAEKLMKLYKSNKYDFIEIGGEDEDGDNHNKITKLKSDGWKIFASEQNFDSYDAILFKNKNNINESLSKDKLDEHVLAFFIKYGVDYYDSDGSILEFFQNNDEEHTDKESIAQFKEALKEAVKKYESMICSFVNVRLTNWKQYNENIDNREVYNKLSDIVTENIQNFKNVEKITVDDKYVFELVESKTDKLLPTYSYKFITE